ncbi:hypothetical protein [uncultured Faecalibaculum sp.]|uniref:hypothetical protein n=1 Tax=uncultured Faecalibaculum sp. TaxID=1729681 RepID=UPI0025D51C47|nr:hypothetical protein [uncultured Faecalibaculum sp.]
MTEEKLSRILRELKGLTYRDWEKIRFGVDRVFEQKTLQKRNELYLEDPEEVVGKIASHYPSVT